MTYGSVEHWTNDKNVPPTYPLVMVEWLDSQFASGWRHADELNENYELPIVYSSGYLVEENDRYVTVVQSAIFYHSVANQIGGAMTIPRGCIKDIYRLRKGKPHG